MFRPHCFVFAGLILLCSEISASGQAIHALAYPQETTTEPDGDLASFGTEYAPPLFGLDESRYQMLIPGTHIPTSATDIVGFEVICQSHTGPVTYTTLEITMANSAISSLSAVMDMNLHSATRVLFATPGVITFSAGQWSPVLFQQSFRHDGVRPIVIEIRKAIDRSIHPPPHRIQIQGSVHPVRTDLPSAVAAVSPYGGGAYFASTGWYGGSFIKVRLLLRDLPTLNLRSDLSGTPGAVFRLGASASLSIQAPAGTPFFAFGDAVFQAPIALPQVQGSLLVLPVVHMFSGLTGPNGSSTFTSGIPVDPSLVGQRAAFQAIALMNGALQTSNACDAVINR